MDEGRLEECTDATEWTDPVRVDVGRDGARLAVHISSCKERIVYDDLLERKECLARMVQTRFRINTNKLPKAKVRLGRPAGK